MNKMKLLSVLVTVAGAGLSVASNVLDKKNQEETIAEKAAEAVAKALEEAKK